MIQWEFFSQFSQPFKVNLVFQPCNHTWLSLDSNISVTCHLYFQIKIQTDVSVCILSQSKGHIGRGISQDPKISPVAQHWQKMCLTGSFLGFSLRQTGKREAESCLFFLLISCAFSQLDWSWKQDLPINRVWCNPPTCGRTTLRDQK